MCQRYVLPDQAAAEREFLPATAWWKFAAKFNVVPEQYVPAIRLHDGKSEGVMLRWGLIPSWAEHYPTGKPKLSVKVERIDTARIYRDAWLNRQRCILPVAGFYVWQLTPEKYRQPFFVKLTDRSVFGLAAVWDRWVSDDDDVIESCSIVRLAANGLLSQIADPEVGMPAILRRRDYQVWLEGDPTEAKSALQLYPAQWMEAYPVSPRINSRAADDPGLIRATG
jgi:putative SOS response-associated peptidase YedK